MAIGPSIVSGCSNNCCLYSVLQGIQEMIKRGLVGDSPEEVALFLYHCKRLDKAQIGEFLSLQYLPSCLGSCPCLLLLLPLA